MDRENGTREVQGSLNNRICEIRAADVSSKETVLPAATE